VLLMLGSYLIFQFYVFKILEMKDLWIDHDQLQYPWIQPSYSSYNIKQLFILFLGCNIKNNMLNIEDYISCTKTIEP
jgi:hypothetical protein